MQNLPLGIYVGVVTAALIAAVTLSVRPDRPWISVVFCAVAFLMVLSRSTNAFVRGRVSCHRLMSGTPSTIDPSSDDDLGINLLLLVTLHNRSEIAVSIVTFDLDFIDSSGQRHPTRLQTGAGPLHDYGRKILPLDFQALADVARAPLTTSPPSRAGYRLPSARFERTGALVVSRHWL